MEITDELISQAKSVSLETGFVRCSVIQRRLAISYPTAAKIIDVLFADGFCVRGEPGEYHKVSARQCVHPTSGDSHASEILPTGEVALSTQVISAPPTSG